MNKIEDIIFDNDLDIIEGKIRPKIADTTLINNNALHVARKMVKNLLYRMEYIVAIKKVLSPISELKIAKKAAYNPL